MPEIADYLNQYLPMAAPYVDKIPGATATVDVGGKKIPYAQSNLTGEPQNLGKAYMAKLDQLERERRISPMKRRMEEYRINLAKQINQSMFGMSPEDAETNAHTVSAASLLSDRLMSALDTDGILPVFEKGMVDFGVTNPALAGSVGKEMSRKNQKLSSLFNHMLGSLYNPDFGKYLHGIRGKEAAELMMDRFAKGDFNDILSNDNFTPDGQLTNKGQKKLMSRLSAKTGIAAEFKELYPADATQSLEAMEKLFGGDPTKLFGYKKTIELFQGIRHSAAVSGFGGEEAQSLLENIASVYKDTGRDPMESLSASENMLIMSGLVKDKWKGKLDPSKFNQTLLSTLGGVKDSYINKTLAGGYAALKHHIGENRAEQAIEEIQKDSKNYADDKSLMQAVARYLPGKVFNKRMSDIYLGTPDAENFLKSGRSSQTALHAHSRYMDQQRTSMLAKSLGASEWDTNKLKSQPATLATAWEYLKTKDLPHEERLALYQKTKGVLDGFAQQNGFENSKAQELFMNSVGDGTPFRNAREMLAKRKSIEDQLALRGKTGGMQGIADAITKGTPGKAWEAMKGDVNLSPEDVARLQGFDYTKLEPAMKEGWNSTFRDFLNPSAATSPVREEANKQMLNLPKTASEALPQLKEMKKESDRGNYGKKQELFRKLYAEDPEGFAIDSKTKNTYGLTHKKTGFRIHMKVSAVPEKLRKEGK